MLACTAAQIKDRLGSRTEFLYQAVSVVRFSRIILIPVKKVVISGVFSENSHVISNDASGKFEFDPVIKIELYTFNISFNASTTFFIWGSAKANPFGT